MIARVPTNCLGSYPTHLSLNEECLDYCAYPGFKIHGEFKVEYRGKMVVTKMTKN